MYRKRHSATSISPLRERSASKFSESRLLYDGQSIHSPTNAALFLENVKQEDESIVADHSEGTPAKTQSVSKWRSSIDGHGMTDMDTGTDSVCYLLKACKHVLISNSISLLLLLLKSCNSARCSILTFFTSLLL